MESRGTISVVVVEDHAITRAGIIFSLKESKEIDVVGEAADGRSAIEVISRLQPQVVLMDIRLPGMDGIEATRVIKSQLAGTRVVMMTSYADDQSLFSSLLAGADGYCTKETKPADIVTAIRCAAIGAAWLDPEVAGRALNAASAHGMRVARDSGDATDHGLSDRELEVLALIVEGNSNQQIADLLFLSPETIKSHVHRILEKLRVNDRTQAAIIALRRGILPPTQKI